MAPDAPSRRPMMVKEAITAGRSTPTLRKPRKMETRDRVIEAARALFSEVGYEEATIREIAKRANVAPGSVFTTFDSKSAVLMEIIFEKYEGLFDEIKHIPDQDISAEQMLFDFGTAAYRFELTELRLLAEQLGASWTWSTRAEAENRRRMAPLFELIVAALKHGIKRGEFDDKLSIAMATEIIFTLYTNNFRRAVFEKWNSAQLADLFKAQLKLFFSGCRPPLR
jgi:AcrR family transcriptional regulator